MLSCNRLFGLVEIKKSYVVSSVDKPIRNGGKYSTHADWSRSLLGNTKWVNKRNKYSHTLDFWANFKILHRSKLGSGFHPRLGNPKVVGSNPA